MNAPGVLVGACPPFPTGLDGLVRSVAAVDSWPVPAGASDSAVNQWVRSRDTFECVAARSFGELVGFASTYEVDRGDPSWEAWSSALGLAPGGMRAVGALLVSPRFRGRGIANALVECALERVRASGRVPVGATRLVVPDRVWRNHGLRVVGIAGDGSGSSVQVWVGEEAVASTVCSASVAVREHAGTMGLVDVPASIPDWES